jgi:zinc transporter ZupT
MLAFTQMIPHALDIFQTHQLDLSYAFKYSVVGYLLILTVEKILFDPNFWKSAAPPSPPSGQIDTKKSASELTESEKNLPKNSTNSGLILVLAMSIHRFFTTHMLILLFHFLEQSL